MTRSSEIADAVFAERRGVRRPVGDVRHPDEHDEADGDRKLDRRERAATKAKSQGEPSRARAMDQGRTMDGRPTPRPRSDGPRPECGRFNAEERAPGRDAWRARPGRLRGVIAGGSAGGSGRVEDGGSPPDRPVVAGLDEDGGPTRCDSAGLDGQAPLLRPVRSGGRRRHRGRRLARALRPVAWPRLRNGVAIGRPRFVTGDLKSERDGRSVSGMGAVGQTRGRRAEREHQEHG
jgi:hypothetical protein